MTTKGQLDSMKTDQQRSRTLEVAGLTSKFLQTGITLCKSDVECSCIKITCVQSTIENKLRLTRGHKVAQLFQLEVVSRELF